MQAHDQLNRIAEPGTTTPRPAGATEVEETTEGLQATAVSTETAPGGVLTQAPAPDRTGVASTTLPGWGHSPLALWLAAAAAVLSVGGYLAEMLLHKPGKMLTWFDLHIYIVAGEHARHAVAILYTWQAAPETKFVYTPFAAIIFAIASELSKRAQHGVMAITSMIAILLTVWYTLGGMGARGRARAAAALVVSAVALWVYPVIWSLHLGQVEPLLMLLVVWDLTQKDSRRWKGVGIGLAAGIKLVPLIFIPYLLLAGKVRQAFVAIGTFVLTVMIGFVVLPSASHKWWITGYMLNTNKNGSVVSLVNQSLLAMMARLDHGQQAGVRPAWLLLSAVVALVAVVAAALLNRAGKPVHGMLLVALAGLLISPISWNNHWVWVVPLLAMLAALALTSAGWVRRGYLAGCAAVVIVFGAWPRHVHGPSGLLPGQAFLGWFAEAGPQTFHDVYHLQGTQVLTWNLYVIAGCVTFALLLIPAWRARRTPGFAPVGETLRRLRGPRELAADAAPAR